MSSSNKADITKLSNTYLEDLLDDRAFCEYIGYSIEEVCKEYVERSTDGRKRYKSGQLK